MDSTEHSGRRRSRTRKKINVLQSKTETQNEEKSTSAQNLAAAKKMKVIDYLVTSFVPMSTTVPQPGIIRIGNTFFLYKGGHLFPKDRKLYGKSVNRGMHFLPSYHWNTVPPHLQQIPSLDLTPYESGVIGPAREIETELAAFNMYITEKMLQTILTHSNDEIKIAQYYIVPKPKCVYPLSINELKAFIGLLYLSASKKHNNLSASFLWDVCGSDIYNLVMSQERFEYLAQCLRFDEYTTRNMRGKRDSFGFIREIWNDFTSKCSEIFRPSRNCTIDEIFVNFNGNCRFKVPLPKQSQNHGIQLILLADSENHYIISGKPCLDKNYNGQIPLAEYMVEKLTKPIHGTHINITYANDTFTSIPLARRMLKLYKLTTIGPFHRNHVEIPPDIISSENRPVGSFLTVYNIKDEVQLYTHCPTSGAVTTLLSSKYFPIEPESKPKVIDYYNSTKGGVSAIKQICYNNSCSRPTKHWYIAVFYAILDLAAINSHTVVNLNRTRSGKGIVRRVEFLYKLALDLMLPQMMERLTDPDTNDSSKSKIKHIMHERLKLNAELNPTKHQIKTVKPFIQDDKSTVNIPQKSTNTRVQRAQDFYPFILRSRPVKFAAAELNTKDMVINLRMQQIQDNNSSVYGETINKTAISYINTQMNRVAFNMQQIPLSPCNSDILRLTVNWNRIQALYPPTQNMKSTFSASNMYTTQHTQQFYQPIEQSNVASFKSFQWHFRNVLMQQIQTFKTLMQTTIPYNIPIRTLLSYNITMNISQNSTSLSNTISPAPVEKPISDLKRECVCGICNNVIDQDHFVQCAKCAVVVCVIHRQILCNNCIFNQPLPPNMYADISKNYICGICHNFFEDLLLNTTQCYKCSQFLCPQHRQILCCFCSNA